MSGADRNYGIFVQSSDTQLKLAHNAADYATFTVADTGDLTIATIGDASIDSDLILDADGQIKLEPAVGKNILLDGTIAVDAGVVTGATSITSTAFVGGLTGNADTATKIASITNSDIVVLAGAQTLTGTKTLNSFKGTGATTVTNILDEDAMGTDSNTALATQQSIKAYVDGKYARSTISFTGQASMISSGNWVTTGQSGISNHTWNQDMGVNTETNGDSTGSLAKQYGHMGVRIPYACTIENIYVAIRNASGNRQATVGLFCARAADGTTAVDWGTTDATEPILQIHADANNESGSYQNRPTHAEVSTDVAMAAGDMFYPAIKLTGITGSGAGDGDNILASFSVGIKTAIA